MPLETDHVGRNRNSQADPKAHKKGLIWQIGAAVGHRPPPFASLRPSLTRAAAPAAVSYWAIVAPRPCVEPVTTQTFASMRFIASILHAIAGRGHHAQQFLVADLGHLQRGTLDGVLLCLDDEPSFIAIGG